MTPELPICFVGRKARRLPEGAGLTDKRLRPQVVDESVPDTTGRDAERRLYMRRGYGEATIIGNASDDGIGGVRLVAMNVPWHALT